MQLLEAKETTVRRQRCLGKNTRFQILQILQIFKFGTKLVTSEFHHRQGADSLGTRLPWPSFTVRLCNVEL